MSAQAQPHARLLTLTRILTQAGVVSQEQVEQAIALQGETGLRSGELLVQIGAATEEDIGWALARQLDLSFVDPRPDTLDYELIRSLPPDLLLRLGALPLVQDYDQITVALSDPTDQKGIAELAQVTGRSVRRVVATASAIRRALRDVHGQHVTGGRPDVAPAPGPQRHHAGAAFLLERLEEARIVGAAEIHLQPRADRLEIWHRVGGQLNAATPQSRSALADLLAWIEALGGPSLAADRQHAFGHLVCPAGPSSIDLSVSLLRQPSGVCVTIEPLAGDVEPVMEWLGFDPGDLGQLREVLSTPAGIGFVAGPPGSGGTTTLEAMAIELERDGRHCIRGHGALGAETTQVGAVEHGVWVGFLHGADAVALDDIPVADLGGTLSAAGSGRWVLARTEATDTFALLEQLAATPLDRAALAERLQFVLQQRLAWRANGAQPGPASGAGARWCAVFELLIVNPALREALRAGAPADVLRARARAGGLVPLAQRLEALVAGGLVSPREATRLAA